MSRGLIFGGAYIREGLYLGFYGIFFDLLYLIMNKLDALSLSGEKLAKMNFFLREAMIPILQ